MKIKINHPDELKHIKGLFSEEQETTVSMGRADTFASIYTSDNTIITKLKKVWLKNLKDYSCEAEVDSHGDVSGYFFKTSKKNISFRTSTPKRELTEEHLQILKDRMSKMRKMND